MPNERGDMVAEEIKAQSLAWESYAERNRDQFDSSTLGPRVPVNEYLVNRIRRAYMEAFEEGIRVGKLTETTDAK